MWKFHFFGLRGSEASERLGGREMVFRRIDCADAAPVDLDRDGGERTFGVPGEGPIVGVRLEFSLDEDVSEGVLTIACEDADTKVHRYDAYLEPGDDAKTYVFWHRGFVPRVSMLNRTREAALRIHRLEVVMVED